MQSCRRCEIAGLLQHEIGSGVSRGVVGGRFLSRNRPNRRSRARGRGAAADPGDVDTIYDCASITKPLVTTTLALQLVPARSTIHGYTVRELLTHTTGLRAWLPLYAFDDPLRAILDHGPECERGTRVIYSDLNFILLWMAIENFDYLARRAPRRAT